MAIKSLLLLSAICLAPGAFGQGIVSVGNKTVKFSIFAAKPPQYSLSRHFHEFRHVHAIQTAHSALFAPIGSYVQGFVPFIQQIMTDGLVANPTSPSSGSCVDSLLPVAPYETSNPSRPPLTVSARLEFPSVQVINATFKSPQYQSTVGAHTFADPQVVFITQELESLAEQAAQTGVEAHSPLARTGLARASLLVTLPSSTNSTDAAFQAKWDAHATQVHAMIAAFAAASAKHPLVYLPLVEYQRHKSVPMPPAEFDAVLDGSPFREAEFRVTKGGYEEIAFLYVELLVAFLDSYGAQLRDSYAQFAAVDNGSNSALNSFAMVCDEAQIIDSQVKQAFVDAAKVTN